MKKIDENKVQQSCWLWFCKEYPDYIMHQVVNGFGITIPASIPKIFHEKIRKMIAMKVNLLEMTGMTKGVADMLIHEKNCRCIWVEFKTSTGTQRDAQIRMQKKVELNGGVYIMPRSLEQFQTEIYKLLEK